MKERTIMIVLCRFLPPGDMLLLAYHITHHHEFPYSHGSNFPCDKRRKGRASNLRIRVGVFPVISI